MKVRQVFITFLLIVMIGAAAAAEEEPRLALVIGNSEYQYFGALKNPANDAQDVSKALEELGFEVNTVLDADYKTLFQQIRDFGEKLAKEPGVGLFYYAGHAIEAGGVNYLIPTDADIRARDEVEFASVAVDLVLSKMETADNPTNIIILDSCRDNPLPETARGSGGNRGLTVVEAPQGSLIVYATEPGSTAADGRGRNSPFTEAFLHHLPTPRLDVELMLRNVRRDVIAATGGKQTPWTNSSLVEPVVLSGKAGGISAGTDAAVRINRAVGAVTVKTQSAGDLYIDEEFVVSMRREEQVTLNNIPAGNRVLEMRYGTDQEEHKITLESEGQTEVIFTYQIDPAEQVKALRSQKSALQSQLTKVTNRRKFLSVTGWVGIGAGVVGTGVGVLGFILGKQAYSDYETAPDTASAEAARDRIEKAGMLVGVGGGVGGFGVSLGSVLFLLRPKKSSVQDEIYQIDTRIKTLQEDE